MNRVLNYGILFLILLGSCKKDPPTPITPIDPDSTKVSLVPIWKKDFYTGHGIIGFAQSYDRLLIADVGGFGVQFHAISKSSGSTLWSSTHQTNTFSLKHALSFDEYRTYYSVDNQYGALNNFTGSVEWKNFDQSKTPHSKTIGDYFVHLANTKTTYDSIGTMYIVVCNKHNGKCDTVFDSAPNQNIKYYYFDGYINPQNELILLIKWIQYMPFGGRNFVYNCHARQVLWEGIATFQLTSESDKFYFDPNENLTFTATHDKIFAFDLTTGTQRWETARPEVLGNAEPECAVIHGNMLIESGFKRICAYEIQTGDLIWTQNFDSLTYFIFDLQVFGDKIFAITNGPNIQAIDLESGKWISKARISKYSQFKSKVLFDPNGEFLYYTDGLYLYCARTPESWK
jgi:outer membrane protein assembly factor BamB